MLPEFTAYYEGMRLFNKADSLLLAVSGGIDSMVLLNLCSKAGLNFSVAHCNFNLRGSESDGDVEFIRNFAEKEGFSLYVKNFDTKEYARINGISIEMAARDLRYNWFAELCREHRFDYVATAHHQDDQIETFFINLLRKTGIKGLSGIKPKSGNIVRPMLFAGRDNIKSYALKNNIPFREDSTNAQVQFKRNYLRHKVIPEFAEIIPSYRENILASINNLKEVEDVFRFAVEQCRENIMEQRSGNPVILIDKLTRQPFPQTMLYEILSEYNFNSAVADEVFSGISEESGKQYFSSTHRVVKDRDLLIITENKEASQSVFYIEDGDLELYSPLHMSISKRDAQDFFIEKKASVACLDFEKLDFPLSIRKWKEGEYFRPLGMTGFKKLSDFFIDEKFSIPEKENTWILYSGEKVAWVIGKRIDDRFKITADTNSVFRLEIL